MQRFFFMMLSSFHHPQSLCDLSYASHITNSFHSLGFFALTRYICDQIWLYKNRFLLVALEFALALAKQLEIILTFYVTAHTTRTHAFGFDSFKILSKVILLEFFILFPSGFALKNFQFFFQRHSINANWVIVCDVVFITVRPQSMEQLILSNIAVESMLTLTLNPTYINTKTSWEFTTRIIPNFPKSYAQVKANCKFCCMKVHKYHNM